MSAPSELPAALLDQKRRHYFVGIGGIGMSALAGILLARGYRVGGSDAHDSPLLARLAKAGAEVHVGHAPEHIRPDDVLILSDAIKPGNPEWDRARELNLPIAMRADLLGAISNAGRGIAVAGTHGKTTTSGMLALILQEAGLNPTCILGGELTPLGGNARPGGPLTVVEACEAYNSFLCVRPEIAVVTNLEPDHLDFHGTPERLYAHFRAFLAGVRGTAVLCGDDPRLREMTGIAPRTVTYGTSPDCDYRITDITLGPEPTFRLHPSCFILHPSASILHPSSCILSLRVPGHHNVLNAAAAAAAALELCVDVETVRHALASFPGMKRRFERIGSVGKVAIVDDYAHHPTEIAATLTAARAVFPGKVIVVFQPHLFSRTRDLLQGFAEALSKADVVYLAPIYPAREAPISGVDHRLLAGAVSALAPNLPVIALDSRDEAVALLQEQVTRGDLGAGDVILTVGAGDIDAVAHALVGGRHSVEPIFPGGRQSSGADTSEGHFAP